MIRLLTILALAFVVSSHQGMAQTPSPVDLSIAHEQFVEVWREYQFESVRELKVGDRLLTYEKEMRAQKGEQVLVHTKRLDDPQNLVDEPVSFTEGIVATIEGSDSLVRFNRSEKLDSKDMPHDPESELDSIECIWWGTLESENKPWARYREMPFLQDMFGIEIKRSLLNLKPKHIRQETHLILGKQRTVFLAKLRSEPTLSSTMYFERQDGELVPIGLSVEKSFPTPGHMPRSQLSEGELASTLKRSRREEWFAVSGSSGERDVMIKSTYRNGSSETLEEKTLLKSVAFSVDDSKFSVSNDTIPDGTEVFIEDSPEKKAEFNNGSIVNVYRGEVIEELGSIKMFSSRRGWMIVAMAAVLVVVIGGVFRQVGGVKDSR